MTGWRGLSMPGLTLSVVGALLLLAGIGLVAMTSRGLLDYREAANQHGGEVVDLGANAHPEPGQYGRMARLVGTPKVVAAPHDVEFNQRVDAPVLVRRVEMFQWREVRVGGRVHYELDWVDRPLDSSHFEEPRGHGNPASFPLKGKQFDAGLVQLGGFRLSPELLHALPGSQRIVPDVSALPENLAASFSLHEDHLVTSARPGAPKLGDMRVSWDEVPLQEITVVARIDGDSLVAAVGTPDGKGHEVQLGDVPVLDLFPDLPVPPKAPWLQWVLSVLLAALGAFLLLAPRQELRDPALALGIGALVVGIVASALWLGNGWLATGGWAALALCGLGLVLWRLRGRLPQVPSTRR